ncbi:hypothetical protein DAMA08_006520 [Martiniozyma asiatica (nom. inval.)]|nr:hypothetical protein DAMA08_006520 [Martiniozyma asiatica]
MATIYDTELAKLESAFWIPTAKLNEIIDHFISELQRGNVDGTDPSGIPMNTAWVVEYPTGSETGAYLALDFGGTNLRVVLVHLLGMGTIETEQSFYKLPDNIRTVQDRNILFDFMAECLGKFLDERYPNGYPAELIFPLGFTFSYPATQSKINSGVLQRWTKGFDIPGVEGEDVVVLLMEKIKERNLPIVVSALINDTCGTLVASRYADPKTEMGCIFGTGLNGSYYERVSNVTKLHGKLPDDIKPTDPMLINCEYGSFDNAHKVLPRTIYDIYIDDNSPRPGQQAYEKMAAGYYMGELLRLIILEQHEKGAMFKDLPDEAIKTLNIHHCVDTSFLSYLEADETEDLSECKKLFADHLAYPDVTFEQRKFAKSVASFIGTRAARLSICGIAAACKKMGYEDCHIAADGSVFMKYPHFPERAAQGLADVYGWGDMDPKDHPIQIVKAHDGSGVGAAVIAALGHARVQKGLSVGFKE